jgi:hypothetical protein
MALDLTGAAFVAVTQAVEGAKLMGAAESARVRTGDEPVTDGAGTLRNALAAAERTIGSEALAAALDAGRALTPEQAVALAVDASG